MTAIHSDLDDQLRAAESSIATLRFDDVLDEYLSTSAIADPVDRWLCGIGNGTQDASNRAHVAGRLMYYLLERAREITIMACVECDEDSRWISDYDYVRRTRTFRQNVCEIAADGIMRIARQSSWLSGGLPDAPTLAGACHPAVQRAWGDVQEAVRCYWTHDYNRAEWLHTDPNVQRLAYA